MKEIYFNVDHIFSLIAQILTKNGIETSLTGDIYKSEQGENSLVGIVFETIKEMAKKNISENDSAFLLKKKLKISEKTIKNILEEVKEKILPFAEEINIDEKPPIIKPENSVQNYVPKKIPKINDLSSLSSKTKKPDTYRESIE